MSRPADTFAAFVTLLSHALDDHEATGADLADRMHLSRFHLDRMISAVAGEPPARLRRRVLLERAAYQLATTRTTVLAVAVAAGYSSHEAFARAFARAYGVPPARWRRRPTRIEVDAPNGVHFHPPAGLRLPVRGKVTGMELMVAMVAHHVWLVGQMLDRAARLPADQLAAPIRISVEGIDDDPTLRSLLARLVGQLEMWHAATGGRGYDLASERGAAVATLRARLAEAGPAFLSLVRDLCEQGRLDETFVNTVCDPPEVFTYGGMIAHVLTFAAHRRTLVAGALSDAGVTDLGAGDPMRWVADHV